MENTNANALNAVKQPSDNKQKQIHLPGELPGQKASPVEQNKKPILEIKGLTKNFANFTAVNNSYAAGRTGFDEVSKWQKYSYYSIGVSCVAGAWFAFEMVRYLFTANQVLPATAGIKKNGNH